jgi:hypothetical protein
LLDGTDVTPVKTLAVEDDKIEKFKVPNPAYAAWITPDATLHGFLVNSFSSELLAHVIGLETTADI